MLPVPVIIMLIGGAVYITGFTIGWIKEYANRSLSDHSGIHDVWAVGLEDRDELEV